MIKKTLLLLFVVLPFASFAQKERFESIENTVSQIMNLKSQNNPAIRVKARKWKNIISCRSLNVRQYRVIKIKKQKEIVYHDDGSNKIRASYINGQLQSFNWEISQLDNGRTTILKKYKFVRNRVILIEDLSKKETGETIFYY